MNGETLNTITTSISTGDYIILTTYNKLEANQIESSRERECVKERKIEIRREG